MEAASEDLEFEKAARFRDQLNRLSRIQEQQYVVGDKGDVDVLAAVQSDEFTCIQVVFVRTGRILGNKTFFPKPVSKIPLRMCSRHFFLNFISVRQEEVKICLLMS